MDRAITRHFEGCTRSTKCPCKVLDVDYLEDGLHEIEVSAEAKKPWIRERLQLLLPSLKAMEPWLELIDAVAQVNPISGHVSGVVKIALKVKNLIRANEVFEDLSIPASLTSVPLGSHCHWRPI